MTGKENPIAYVLKDDIYGEFAVLNSANAWWLDRIKVMKLFDAYKFDCTDLEAMAYAGVSRMQFQYFKELHPDFYEKKELCMQNLGLIARKKLGDAINRGEGGAILAYLRKKHRGEWGGGSQLPPGANPHMPELPGSDIETPTDVDQRNMIVFVDFSQGSKDELLHAGEQKPVVREVTPEPEV